MKKFFIKQIIILAISLLPLSVFAEVYTAKEIAVIKAEDELILTCGFKGKNMCFSIFLPKTNNGNLIVDMLGSYSEAAIGYNKKLERSTTNIETLLYGGVYSISAIFNNVTVVITSRNRFESPENLIIWFEDL